MRRTTRWTIPVRDEEDIRALEQLPYDVLVTSHSTYEIFETSTALHGDRPAVTVLGSADPSDTDSNHVKRRSHQNADSCL